jgi:hypothetical protein
MGQTLYVGHAEGKMIASDLVRRGIASAGETVSVVETGARIAEN